MITSLLVALALAQDVQPAQPPAPPPAQPFTAMQEVKQTDRLAITPVLDGKIEPEEWDPFASEPGFESYFEWQPRRLHFAGTLPVGKDFVASVDMKGDGWLVGSDNVEVRVTWSPTGAKAKVRLLDATKKAGPTWKEDPELQKCVKCAATGDAATWTVEVTLEDPGTGIIGKAANVTIGLRTDALPAEQTDIQPFLPRVMTPVKLVLERATGLVPDLVWKPEVNGRTVVPGGSTRIRFTFKGKDEMGLKRIEMRTEGPAEDATTLKAQPFPSFDRKGRAFVDYSTSVSTTATEGYRVARATVQRSDGDPVVLQVSYEISPVVTFDLNLPAKLKSTDKEQDYTFSVYLRSNVLGRLDGTFVVVPPEGWQVQSGSDKQFVIYASRGSVRRAFKLSIPAGAEGTFPLKLVADFGRGRTVERSFWISLQ